MGVGSNKSSGAGVVVWCVVLGLALFVAGVTASKNSPNYCRTHCSGRQDQKTCYIWCMRGVRLGAHGRTTEGEKAVGGIGAPPTCRVRCRHSEDIDACVVKRCQSEIEGEEARGAALGFLAGLAEGREREVEAGGGGAGLLEMPTEHAGRQDGEKKKQADTSQVWRGQQTKQKDLDDTVYSCEPKCGQQFDPSSAPYVGCMFGCDFGFADGVRLEAHGSTRGEEDKEMKHEIDNIHQLSNTRCEEQCSALYDPSSASYSQCMTICSMI